MGPPVDRLIHVPYTARETIAAQSGHLEVLQWACANGCPSSEHACHEAACINVGDPKLVHGYGRIGVLSRRHMSLPKRPVRRA